MESIENYNKILYNKQMKNSLIQLLMELPNYIFVLVSAILSGNMIMFMDVVDSSSAFLHNSFVVLLSRKLKKDLRFEYNYGIGKLEAIASLCCEVIVFIGAICVIIFSFIGIIRPKKPSDILIYIVILKIVNIIVDAFFWKRQKKIKLTKKTKLTKTEYINAKEAFIFDIVAFVVLWISYGFRYEKIIWYLSPVMCIILSIYFSIGTVDRIKKAIDELTDRTVEEDIQLKVMTVMAKYFDEYLALNSVNSHRYGTTVVVDLEIEFDNEKKYSDIKTFIKKVSNELNKDEECQINIRVN